MKGSILTRELIESILRSSNLDFVEATEEKVRGLVTMAVEDLSTKVPYVSFNNVILEPVNEALSGGFTDNSKFEYFFGVDNPQLEINSMRNDFWKRFKDRVVFAWKNRNAGKKKRRRKKDEPEIKPLKSETFDPEKYNLNSLAHDLQLTIANYLSATSIVYLEGNRIRIVGKDDFGTNTQIIIYVTLYNNEYYRYFLSRKKGFLKFDNALRIAAINKKADSVGIAYVDMIKVFNTLYYNINHFMPNQIFIESLLYNCPDELYVENSYDCFVKILNFLIMADIKDFKSIVNPDKSIFTDPVCGSSAMGYRKMLDKLIDLNQ